MDTALVVLAVAFLFGGVFLMVSMGYLNSERERAQEAKAAEAEAAARATAMMTVPGFFARPDATIPKLDIVFDEALVSRLEHHVRLEQAMVAQFVHHPSVDNLYRQPGTAVHVH